MRPPVLLLLLLLLAGPGVNPEIFVPRSVEHAGTPLLTVQLISPLQCAVLCLRTTDCLKWLHESGECRLLPLHSADNPLTTAAATVYQRRHPPGYIPMPSGGGVTYKPHTKKTPAGPVLIELCREEDPQAVPAFITSDAQFNFLMSLTLPTCCQWVSNNDFEEEGVYKDLFNKSTVNVDNWISVNHSQFPSETEDSFMLRQGYGLINRPYTKLYSYLCEYWM